MNESLSKLKHTSVSRMIHTNPFFKLKHAEQITTLQFAVDQTLIHVHKLKEVCKYLNSDTYDYATELLRQTEILQEKCIQFSKDEPVQIKINERRAKMTPSLDSLPKPWIKKR